MTPEYIIAIGQSIAYAVGIPMGIYWIGRLFVTVAHLPESDTTYSFLDKIGKQATWKSYSTYPYASNKTTKNGDKDNA
jgi:hypothetical protein